MEHSITYPMENQSDNDLQFAKEVQDAMEAGKSLVRATLVLPVVLTYFFSSLIKSDLLLDGGEISLV